MLTDIATTPYRQSDEGILYHYDIGRSKWLSIERQVFIFGINHKNVKGLRWLENTGGVLSQNSGCRLFRNATITAVSVQTKGICTGAFCVQASDDSGASDLLTINLKDKTGMVKDGLNINLIAGSFFRVGVLPGGLVHYPVLSIETAWKADFL